MAVATAALSVSLDVGDRLAQEFRSLGANLVVTPAADSLPLEIGGVDYRPANSGAYLPVADLPKIKSIYWHNNIIAFAPTLETPVEVFTNPHDEFSPVVPAISLHAVLLGTWINHPVPTPDGGTVRYRTGQDESVVAGRRALVSRECRRSGDWHKVREPRGAKNRIHLNLTLDKLPKTLNVVGTFSSGGPEDEFIVGPLGLAQQVAGKEEQYRKLYVSALTKPEDSFAKRNPKTMSADEFERWSCSPYVFLDCLFDSAGFAGDGVCGCSARGRGRRKYFDACADAVVAGDVCGAAGGGTGGGRVFSGERD